ncbi:MAG: flagellar basal-body rod protein FlgF [Deltaproteobacteria bacterium]|jgi:flagellar basal-body rod protein FlgF|nr:flagellar basal-body rod protein FlgF [Deltaproteobacteria bacterium]
MSGSIYMAASGALAYQHRMEILSNNIANTNTVGFKQDKTEFHEYYASALENSNPQTSASTDATQVEDFWFELTTHTDHSSGPLRQTGSRFDLAIKGNGFFCIETPDGIQYTRRGDFGIDVNGNLVTQEGWPVLGEGGEIPVESQADFADMDGREMIVHGDGSVEVDGNIVGKLRIVEFSDPQQLMKAGNTNFIVGPANPPESVASDYRIAQGMIELSNVDAVRMMTELIETLRGFESYQKVISSIDEVNSLAIKEVGEAY